MKKSIVMLFFGTVMLLIAVTLICVHNGFPKPRDIAAHIHFDLETIAGGAEAADPTPTAPAPGARATAEQPGQRVSIP